MFTVSGLGPRTTADSAGAMGSRWRWFCSDWTKLYALPFHVTTSRRLQCLQYRITHRYFPTRRFLFTRGVVDDPFCDNCGEVETMPHLFFNCSMLRPFWDGLLCAINRKRPEISLSEYDVMFGGIRLPAVVNLVIMLAKQFITYNRHRDSMSNMQAFRSMLLKAFEMERTVAVKRGRIDNFRKRLALLTENNTLTLWGMCINKYCYLGRYYDLLLYMQTEREREHLCDVRFDST